MNAEATVRLLRLPAVLLVVGAAGLRADRSQSAGQLEWLPPGTVWVSGGGVVPFIQWLDQLSQKPACYADLRARIARSSSAGDLVSSVYLFEGRFERDSDEHCIVDLIKGLDVNATISVSHAGMISDYRSAGVEVFHAAWSTDGRRVVVGKNRPQVESAIGRPAGPSAALRRVFDRVDTRAFAWIAIAFDLTGILVGIPCEGIIVATDPPPIKVGPGARFDATIYFSSSGRARDFVAAVSHPTRADLPEVVLRRLPLLHPRMNGGQVTVDVGAIFADTSFMEALTPLLARRAAEIEKSR